MPKMKTNRTAYKKFRVSKNGRVKRARANRSHNTAKRTAKRMRQLRKLVTADKSNLYGIFGQLPYA